MSLLTTAIPLRVNKTLSLSKFYIQFLNSSLGFPNVSNCSAFFGQNHGKSSEYA